MPFDCVTTAMALTFSTFLNICINFLIKQVLCTAFRSNVKCAMIRSPFTHMNYMEQMALDRMSGSATACEREIERASKRRKSLFTCLSSLVCALARTYIWFFFCFPFECGIYLPIRQILYDTWRFFFSLACTF